MMLALLILYIFRNKIVKFGACDCVWLMYRHTKVLCFSVFCSSTNLFQFFFTWINFSHWCTCNIFCLKISSILDMGIRNNWFSITLDKKGTCVKIKELTSNVQFQ